MTPAEAEMHFLENVKKLSMYGVDLHHAKVKYPWASVCTVTTPLKSRNRSHVEACSMTHIDSSAVFLYHLKEFWIPLFSVHLGISGHGEENT